MSKYETTPAPVPPHGVSIASITDPAVRELRVRALRAIAADYRERGTTPACYADMIMRKELLACAESTEQLANSLQLGVRHDRPQVLDGVALDDQALVAVLKQGRFQRPQVPPDILDGDARGCRVRLEVEQPTKSAAAP